MEHLNFKKEKDEAIEQLWSYLTSRVISIDETKAIIDSISDQDNDWVNQVKELIAEFEQLNFDAAKTLEKMSSPELAEQLEAAFKYLKILNACEVVENKINKILRTLSE
jgi:hypothetical protein